MYVFVLCPCLLLTRGQDQLWRTIMGLGLSRLPSWDDNHSGCPLISTGIQSVSKTGDTQRGEGVLLWVDTHLGCFLLITSYMLYSCFVHISCQMGWEKWGAAVKKSFFLLVLQKSEFMFYGNKIWLSPPLPPDGPCGERVIIWLIWGREPESVDVGWAVLCHAKPPVPRSLNMIPCTCPPSLVLSLPPPPHQQLDLLNHKPPSHPPISPPWDKLSPIWQGLAWITWITGQVRLLRKVSSVVCEAGKQIEEEQVSKDRVER